MDIGQVAVAEDLRIGMLFLQTTQQCEQSLFLHGRACVGRITLLVETTFVADAERVPVVVFGMGTDQILVARLDQRGLLVGYDGMHESFLRQASPVRRDKKS